WTGSYPTLPSEHQLAYERARGRTAPNRLLRGRAGLARRAAQAGRVLRHHLAPGRVRAAGAVEGGLGALVRGRRRPGDLPLPGRRRGDLLPDRREAGRAVDRQGPPGAARGGARTGPAPLPPGRLPRDGRERDPRPRGVLASPGLLTQRALR